MGGPGALPVPALPECSVHLRSDGLPHLQDGPPGVGIREAVARRGVLMLEERRMQREEKAHFFAHVHGAEVVQKALNWPYENTMDLH